MTEKGKKTEPRKKKPRDFDKDPLIMNVTGVKMENGRPVGVYVSPREGDRD